MQLYVTPTSPYAWMARIVVLEKGMADRVAFLRARTRTAGSWYYAVNPSGRVPFLVRDDGTGIEDSALIIAWLDHADGAPRFDHPAGAEGWESRRLEARARSLLDGLCVWSRELHRPEDERSPTIIAHEQERARRLFDWWDDAIGHALMTGPLNLAQITLACALRMDNANLDLDWRAGRPALAAWAETRFAIPSIAEATPAARGDYFDPPEPV